MTIVSILSFLVFLLSLYPKWISGRQHIVGSSFLIQSDCLCFLTGDELVVWGGGKGDREGKRSRLRWQWAGDKRLLGFSTCFTFPCAKWCSFPQSSFLTVSPICQPKADTPPASHGSQAQPVPRPWLLSDPAPLHHSGHRCLNPGPYHFLPYAFF